MKRNEAELNRATMILLSATLPAVGGEAQRFLEEPFGYNLAFGKPGKRAEQNGTMWCAECGQSFNKSEVNLHANPRYEPKSWFTRKYITTCPHCGKTLELHDVPYRKRTLEDIVGIHTTIGEWQVDRLFNSICYCNMGKKVLIDTKEVAQVWTKGGQSYTYVCPKVGYMRYRSWAYNKPWRLGDAPEAERWWDGTEAYDMPADFDIEAEIAKRGISLNALHGIKLTQIIMYMRNPHFETLWKQGDWQIAKFFKTDIDEYWAQIKIARRRGYKIADLTEWRDLIDMCRRTNRDAYSPKYICPANLHEMHQRLVMADRRKANERLLAGVMQYNKDYCERIQKYLGMNIHDDYLTIVVLPNIPAFKEEADHLCHCVFSCAYYNRVNSLLLSARDGSGKRWETIEVDLNSFKILQSYGYGDKHTERHKEILDLVNSNMWQIRERRLAMAS